MTKALLVIRHAHLHGAIAIVTLGVACSGDHAKFQLHGDDDAAAPATSSGGAKGTGGTKGGGGTGAANGATEGSGGDPSICHAATFSSAPLICLQDWKHVQAKYAAQCVSVGGYQGHCDPYDALIYHSAGKYTWCYYDTGTGNLIGARSTDDPAGTGGTCVAFDTSFAEPSVTSCTPASGTCPNP